MRASDALSVMGEYLMDRKDTAKGAEFTCSTTLTDLRNHEDGFYPKLRNVTVTAWVYDDGGSTHFTIEESTSCILGGCSMIAPTEGMIRKELERYNVPKRERRKEEWVQMSLF